MRSEEKRFLPLVRLGMQFADTIRKKYWQLTRSITVGVRCVALKNNEVLLIQHTYRKGWYLPGGGVKFGETIEQAARRELEEEVGAKVGLLGLLGVYTDFQEGRTDHKIVFVGEVIDFSPRYSVEVENIQFFPSDHLPDGLSHVFIQWIEQGLTKNYGQGPK